jgi:hypothetical protein
MGPTSHYLTGECPLRERLAGVSTYVVDSINLSIDIKERNSLISHLAEAAGTEWNLVQLGHLNKLTHVRPPSGVADSVAVTLPPRAASSLFADA